MNAVNEELILPLRQENRQVTVGVYRKKTYTKESLRNLIAIHNISHPHNAEV